MDSIPADLGAAGRALWRDLTDGLELRRDERVVVSEACRTADVIASLDAVLAAEGVTATGSTGQRIVHPAVLEVRQQRALLSALLRRVEWPSLDADERGSGWAELSASARARRAALRRWNGAA